MVSSMIINRRIKMKPVIAVPKGSILPSTIEIPIIEQGTFIEKLVANAESKIAIVVLTTEELIALVEKPHLFGVDVIALVGVPGGRYDAVWSSYVAPLRRLSLETLDSEVKKILAADTTALDAKIEATPDLHKDALSTRTDEDEPQAFE